MELQFRKSIYPCLQQVKWEVRSTEQTQEVRVGDGMPDIGRVLGAWGQVLLRGKQWRSGSMNVSGGVMVWVLYAPEEGGMPQCVESWIPFQVKWDLPETQRDGNILASCLLRSVDARCISARKLLVRAGVSVLGQAVVPGETGTYIPEKLPEGVQLLKNTYPVELPVEAGEKPFSLDEDIMLPSGAPEMESWVYYTLQPEVLDEKVMAGKAVFRGNANLHLLYRGGDGELHCCDLEFPFSQYAELEGTYDQSANVAVLPEVTGLELEKDEEGRWKVKAGILGQYTVYDRAMMDVVEDAYCPQREGKPVMEQVQMAAVLDRKRDTVTAEQTVQTEGTRMVDLSFLPDQGTVLPGDGIVDVEVPGQFQLLYYDGEGNLQNLTARCEEVWDMPASRDSAVTALVRSTGRPQASFGGSNIQLRGDFAIDTVTTAKQGITMVKSLELGEEKEKDPNRPSLILRRAGEEGLWEMAKSSGTTVDAICKANGIEGEPDSGKMLLIPIP